MATISYNLKETAKTLLEQDGFLLLTHRNPDGDTLCSAAALCSALRRCGKTAWLYDNVQITDRYRPFVAAYLAPPDFTGSYTVAVDTAAPSQMPEGYSKGTMDLCIDHHPTNSHYALAELVWPDKAACGQIILKLIEKLCGGLTGEEADLLYIALSTDCGCFQYANTDAAALLDASRMVKYGADIRRLNKLFFRTVSRARVMLESMIYSSMTFHRGGKVAVATVGLSMLRQCNASEDDCDDLAALPGKVDGVVVGITIREQEDGVCRISVRTTEEASAIAICEAFGGGGHRMAAGCRIEATTGRAKELLLAVVDEVYK